MSSGEYLDSQPFVKISGSRPINHRFPPLNLRPPMKKLVKREFPDTEDGRNLLTKAQLLMKLEGYAMTSEDAENIYFSLPPKSDFPSTKYEGALSMSENARQLMAKTVSSLESRGFPVVYQDTDSMFVVLPGPMDGGPGIENVD